MSKVWREEELMEKIRDIYENATNEVAFNMVIDVIGWIGITEYFWDTLESDNIGDLKYILNKYKEEV